MDAQTYEKVYSKLSDDESVSRLSKKYRVSSKMLEVLLTQKTIRETKRNYSRVKDGARALRLRWKKGESFMDLAKSLSFPPVMVASIVLADMGFGRGRVRALLKNPSSAGDERLSRELSSVLRRDLVYSPAANREQARRGRFVEETVGEWLSGLGLSYKTEADCRREGRVKTPDFLLDSPSVVCGRRVNWVESKASFGDYIEVKSDSRKQVRHYVDLFGPGAVVYWYGFLGESFRGDVTLLSHSDIKGKTK